MDDIHWFTRLADISQVGYSGQTSVDRRSIPGHDIRPEIRTSDFDPTLGQWLMWPTAGGSTSASPASGWFTADDRQHVSASIILRRIRETLELPGTAADYHFALLAACQILWRRFRHDADTLLALEELCLLDIALVEARQDIVNDGTADNPQWLSIPAFDVLTRLYEGEGYIQDALAIARLGAKLGQDDDQVQRLEESVAALGAERA
jgi:hypothetical protein